MIAIFSNWSNSENSGFLSQNDYILSLALSVKCAKKIFPEVHFYGDKQSISLIEGKVAFDKVFDSLEVLNEKGIPHISAYPRVYIYSLMTQPFIHINSDVYIWEPLPENILNAEIFCQGYETNYFNKGIAQLRNSGFIGNDLWEEYALNGPSQQVPSMEIFGGQNIEWIKQYASDIINMIEFSPNLEILRHKRFFLPDINIALEEWYNLVRSLYDGMTNTMLCSDEGKFPIKYTHVVSEAKKNKEIMNTLRTKCNKELPNIMMNLLYNNPVR